MTAENVPSSLLSALSSISPALPLTPATRRPDVLCHSQAADTVTAGRDEALRAVRHVQRVRPAPHSVRPARRAGKGPHRFEAMRRRRAPARTAGNITPLARRRSQATSRSAVRRVSEVPVARRTMSPRILTLYPRCIPTALKASNVRRVYREQR